MEIKTNVTWKFKVNGKEYGSVEEMPAADRETYEKAVGPLSVELGGHTLVVKKRRIVLNGQEYESVDAMPEDIREAYRDIMKMVEAGKAAPGAPDGHAAAGAPALPRPGGPFARRGPRPIAPESFSVRKLAIGAAIAALLAGLYILTRG